METFSRDRRLKTYEDIVKEDPLPASFGGFGTVFGPVDMSRKLKPMRTQTARSQMLSNKLKLVVNIQSAANLPDRIDKKPMNVLIEATFQVSLTSQKYNPGLCLSVLESSNRYCIGQKCKLAANFDSRCR